MSSDRLHIDSTQATLEDNFLEAQALGRVYAFLLQQAKRLRRETENGHDSSGDALLDSHPGVESPGSSTDDPE